MNFGLTITQELAGATIAAALSRRVGRAHAVSYETLSNELDIPVETVRSHGRGGATPSLCSLLRYCAFFGADFTNEILRPANLGGVEPVQPAGDANGFTQVGRLSTELAELGKRLEDGRLCHQDRAVLIPRMRALSADVDAFASAMEHAPGWRAPAQAAG